MIYLYDPTRIDDLKANFSENKKIDITHILSHDFTNLVELEDICSEVYPFNNLVIDLSALMNPSAYNSLYIGKIFHLLDRAFNSPIFWLNKSKYEIMLKELPLLFDETAINEDFANPKVQKLNLDEVAKDYSVNEINDKVQKAVDKLVGHSLFKADFVKKYENYKLLEKISVRKIFSVFLIGESGIGKTEFAKILSKSLYPNGELIKINFGNYSTEGVLNSLIGSPLGYIGSDEGGELIKKINSSKSKIILIDEFEKATPSVFNFFYELLEDGSFTDRHGIVHDLSGYMIIFTSNMTPEYFTQHIPNSLKSRFDLTSDFQIPSIEEKQLFIKVETNILVNKLTEYFKVSYKVTEELMEKILKLSSEDNLRHIKRLLQDIITKDFREKKLDKRS
ncbi:MULTISPECIES: AAA family ATPase [Streptococcus]|jgi:ATP-dependent clp protease, ATPase subunit, putative|uniref:AAA family ATPase n=1 Tax=Streptococcus TaxID=1301 RepID=UPI00177AB80D|nr:AAA family ATPase [Streptococcus mitis]